MADVTSKVDAVEEGPWLMLFIKNSKFVAPVVPDASKVKSSPSHITLFVAPLTKSMAGNAVVFTVIVTTFEAAPSIFEAIGHVLVPKLT